VGLWPWAAGARLPSPTTASSQISPRRRGRPSGRALPAAAALAPLVDDLKFMLVLLPTARTLNP
ncbi:MAG: hypothetical protein ACKOHK_16350, partial [Planctomycetia bacterium]